MKHFNFIVFAATMAITQTGVAASDQELKEATAFILNMNGLLCDKVVDIRPLKARKDVYEVECIEYGGGETRKTYIMDARKGTAWVP